MVKIDEVKVEVIIE